MADFIISIAICIYVWWIRNNSRFQKFGKNFIVSLGVAWIGSTAIASLSELVLGFMLVFQWQTSEEIIAMSNTVFVVVFWSFVGILGLGVYLGLRALMIDILRKTQNGYRDTFGLKPSTEERLEQLESDMSTIKKRLMDN